jgi:dihydroneopterin aldolase
MHQWNSHHALQPMSSTFTIQLHRLQFTALHGLYSEEAAAGNEFEVNLSLTVNAPHQKVLSLDESINYAEVYRIVKAVFASRTDLLETLAMEMAAELKKAFPVLQNASIQIVKLHPPITAFTGSVSVTYNTSFED